LTFAVELKIEDCLYGKNIILVAIFLLHQAMVYANFNLYKIKIPCELKHGIFEVLKNICNFPYRSVRENPTNRAN
jgi:hypothetical protein